MATANRTLTMLGAAGLSVAVHVTILITVAMLPVDVLRGGAVSEASALLVLAPDVSESHPQPDDMREKPEVRSETPPRPEPIVVPGVDGSTAEVETWKGVREAEVSVHQAPKGDVEQAGWTPTPGETRTESPATPVENGQSSEESAAPADAEAKTPLPVPEAKSDDNDPASDHPIVEDASRQEAPDATGATMVDKAIVRSLPDSLIALPEFRATISKESAPAVGEISDGKNSDPSRAPDKLVRTSADAPAPSTDGRAGLPGDDESDARSIEDHVEIRLGAPVARQGLRIRTSYARFSTSTMLLTRPRNPLVRVTFGRDGRVIRAEFVPGQTTGYDDVDKPLLDSLHRWRASGRDLLRIPAGNPQAGITITFRIIFDGRVRG